MKLKPKVMAFLRFLRWMAADEIAFQMLLRFSILTLVVVVVQKLWSFIKESGILAKSILLAWYARVFNRPLLLRSIELDQKLKTLHTFHEWARVAVQRDILDGKWNWKEHSPHPSYDFLRVQGSLDHLIKLMETKDIEGIMRFVRTHLVRNFCGIGSSELFITLRIGTKSLIERYVDQCIKALNLITLETESSISAISKLALLRETRHGFGRTALVLFEREIDSRYSIGVLKALHDNFLLPSILCASGIASLYIAALGIFDEDELPSDFWDSSFWSQFEVSDPQTFVKALKKRFGDITFAEAYQQTGRSINIIVAPENMKTRSPRLLNFICCPNVLIRSAILAGCAGSCEASPFPVELLEKHDGEVTRHYSMTMHWCDGSNLKNMPIERLSELFNVNHFIVSHSQKIFKQKSRMTPLDAFVSFWTRQLSGIALDVLNRLPESSWSASVNSRLHESFIGDIAIFPDEYSNSSNHIEDAQNYTFSKIPLIFNQCAIEFCLDESINWLRKQLHVSVPSENPQLQRHSQRTQSWTLEQFALLRESATIDTASEKGDLSAADIQAALDLDDLH